MRKGVKICDERQNDWMTRFSDLDAEIRDKI
jgi:hypothetical protein